MSTNICSGMQIAFPAFRVRCSLLSPGSDWSDFDFGRDGLSVAASVFKAIANIERIEKAALLPGN